MTVGLMGMLAWTTLCLGGYLAETMVITSWAVFGLTALGGFCAMMRAGGGRMRVHIAWGLPVPFLLYALASVLWVAPAQWLAWREWLLWVQMWLVFGLTLHFGRSRGQTALIVGTFVVLGLAGVGLAAYQRFTDASWMMLGRTQAEQYNGRSAGMFGIPNSLAAWFELMIPVGLAWFFARGGGAGRKILSAWVVALLVFGLVLTGSRGGWIGLALALMLWAILAGRSWWTKLWVSGVILLVAAAGVAALFRFSDHARGRIQPFLDGRFETTRPIIWKSGVQIWQDHPWFGSGAASYNVVFDRYRARGFLNEPDWAHNDYLNTLSDYGVVGFALWALAGVGLLACAWRAVRRTSAPATGARFVGGAGWRWGLLIGLVAFALHLAVDFHTKIPALAFAAAIGAGLLLRDEPGLWRVWPAWWVRAGGLGLGIAALGLGATLADPLYRSEALRFEARRSIDRFAISRKGELREILPVAREKLQRAVEIYPQHGQAWADLSYATVQSWHVTKGDLLALGREAEEPARRALALCGITAEYWLRLGVALDMQARRDEGGICFRRATELAPNSAMGWYYYAYHLQAIPARKAEAKQALATCLSLDPHYGPAVALQRQLGAPR